MFVWQAHEKAVTALAFGPDGRLASAGIDGWITVWNPLTGAEELRIRPASPAPNQPPCHTLSVSPDGNWLATLDGIELFYLDLATGESHPIRRWMRATALKPVPARGSVLVLATPPAEYGYLATARLEEITFPGGVFVRDSGRPPLSGQAVAVSPDGISVAVHGRLFEWEAARLRCMFDTHGLNGQISDLGLSADGNTLFGLVRGKVLVWRLWPFATRTKLKGHAGRISAMAMTPDGASLWTASHDATVKCWDTTTLQLNHTFQLQTGGLDCLAISPDGNLAAAGSGQKGTITVWDLG